ncbi:MAG: cyclic nucleotide-binding/CBS domain-containing protein [Planctomycetota bacterium]
MELICKGCNKVFVGGVWRDLAKGEAYPPKADSSYCRLCVMEMAFEKHKALCQKMNLRVIDLARPLPMTGKLRSVATACQILLESNTAILGVGETQVEGVITERDIVRRVVAKKLDPAVTVLSSVMTHPVVKMPGDASVAEAAITMSRLAIRHVVLEGTGSPLYVSSTIVTEALQMVLSRAYAMGVDEGVKSKGPKKKY